MSDNLDQVDELKRRVALERLTAVQEAMAEVVKENRTEIVKRARAKLVAKGLQVEEAEDEPSL